MSKGKYLAIFLLGIGLSSCSFPFPGNGVGVTEVPPETVPVATGEISRPAATTTATPIPVATSTPAPSATPVELRDPTPTVSGHAGGSSIGGDQEQIPPFVVQPGSPVVASNFVEPDQGCNFLGVGGQVFDIDSEPVKGLIVEAHGNFNGDDILQLSLTGSAPVLGPGGFVIQLAGQPIESEESFWLQMYDLEGNTLSEKIYFPTYSDCGKNFVLINFMQVSQDQYTHRITLPVILNRQIPGGSLP